MKRVIIAANDSTHQRKIQAILDKLESEGYSINSAEARDYADAAAQLIASVEDVDEWFEDTLENYPDDLVPFQVESDEDTSMENYLWGIIHSVDGPIFKVGLAEAKDQVIIDFERVRDDTALEWQIMDAFRAKGYKNAQVVYNTGTEIVIDVPGLESSTNVGASTDVTAAFGFKGSKSKKRLCRSHK